MKKIIIINLAVILGLTSIVYSQPQPLKSGVFNWEALPVKKTSSGEIRNYFRSPTKDLEMFEVNAVTLDGGKGIKTYSVQGATDELIIIKEGSAEVKVNDESKVLGEGSVVVASAGDKVTITNRQKTSIVYFSFLFSPEIPLVHKQNEPQVKPLFVDWQTVEFKPNTNGGRRDIMRQATSTLRELEIHVTTLKDGISSHSPHSHPDEEFVLMRYGNAEMDLDGVGYKGGPGSLFFLAGGGSHGLSNVGNNSCEYFAIRWLTGPAKSE
jgi:(S)-ureidoglycine aminohydrolase